MALVADRMETTLCTRPGTPNPDASPHRSEQAVTPLVSRALGRAREGDREAFRFLYARYADEVYGHALTLVSSADEAKGVTRLVFAELERLIDRYAAERDVPFPAWIRRVTCIVATDDLRR
jgi:DNA-directed RNA polymerase specialized sigma24 family protein